MCYLNVSDSSSQMPRYLHSMTLSKLLPSSVDKCRQLKSLSLAQEKEICFVALHISLSLTSTFWTALKEICKFSIGSCKESTKYRSSVICIRMSIPFSYGRDNILNCKQGRAKNWSLWNTMADFIALGQPYWKENKKKHILLWLLFSGNNWTNRIYQPCQSMVAVSLASGFAMFGVTCGYS